MIGECIDSVKPFADEVVVVLDSKSVDRTAEVCKERGARVEERDWPGFVEQKNRSIELATHPWVFCLDADERASPELAERIKVMKQQGFTADAYEVNRKNRYLGRWMVYGGWYPDRNIRLFNKAKGRWGGVNPHAHVVLDEDARCKRLGLDLLHYPYRDLTHHVQVINSYSTVAAQEKIGRGERSTAIRIIAHPIAKFLKVYVLQAGFRAGTRGLIHAVMGSYSVFLKYAKLWESQRRNPTDRTS